MTSKDWTLNDAIGYLRILTNQIDTSKVQSNFLIDALHGSLSEVNQYTSVGKVFDYGIKTTITATVSGKYATASLASYTTNPVNKIVKIVDPLQTTGKKLCVEVTQAQFDNMKNILQSTTGTIFWTRSGNDILLYSGDLTISASLEFWYVGYPKKITTLTDYFEIKDPYVGLMLSKTKLKLYEIIQSMPKDNINQGLNNLAIEQRNSDLQSK